MRKPVFLVVAVTLFAAVLPASAVAASSVKVGVYDNYFTKASSTKKCTTKTCISMTSGRKVIWSWKGEAPHNVTLVDAPSKIREKNYSDYSSDTQVDGSFAKRLKSTGTYLFVCTIHSEMQQKIKVKAAK